MATSPAVDETEPSGSVVAAPRRRTVGHLALGTARRLFWLWPALLTLTLGTHAIGRPQLWSTSSSHGT